jgi:hypothetical protein
MGTTRNIDTAATLIAFGAARSRIARRLLIGAAALLLSASAAAPQVQAADIITFDDNANSCGGAVICSTNGTTGYLNTGAGQAFHLSTINSWFQIDTDGINHLATQTSAEPDGGAGGFLVTNDTGSTVTAWSITLTDTFTSSTASVNHCSGSSGPYCDQFQDNRGAAAPGGATESLSGPDIFSCSTAALSGTTCNSSGSNAVAEFEPNMITYNWYGLNIAANSQFDISFASWQNGNSAFPTPPTVPEPGSLAMFASAIASFGGLGWFRRRRAA